MIRSIRWSRDQLPAVSGCSLSPIQTIATATEEQSATAEEVNRNMSSINDIARQLSVSVGGIKGTFA